MATLFFKNNSRPFDRMLYFILELSRTTTYTTVLSFDNNLYRQQNRLTCENSRITLDAVWQIKCISPEMAIICSNPIFSPSFPWPIFGNRFCPCDSRELLSRSLVLQPGRAVRMDDSKLRIEKMLINRIKQNPMLLYCWGNESRIWDVLLQGNCTGVRVLELNEIVA